MNKEATEACKSTAITIASEMEIDFLGIGQLIIKKIDATTDPRANESLNLKKKSIEGKKIIARRLSCALNPVWERSFDPALVQRNLT